MISNNHADEHGGGVTNGGTLFLRQSTVSGNSAPNALGGGEIENFGTATLSFVTITQNHTGHPGNVGAGGGGINAGGTMSIDHTLIAGNTTARGRNPGPDCVGTLTSKGFNLIGNNKDCTINALKASDKVGTPANPIDPKLGPLADGSSGNGAPPVHALLAGSPAIDAGKRGLILQTTHTADQRLFRRPAGPISLPFGPAHDIGAYELNASPICGLASVAATIFAGTSGDDALIGTPGPDVIHGLGGNDTIEGLGGNDVICGGTGDDEVEAGPGGDVVNGGDGSDDLRGAEGNDSLRGGEGPDELRGGSGNDGLEGGPENDTLIGNGGDDLLRGDLGDGDECDGGNHVNGDTATGCESVSNLP